MPLFVPAYYPAFRCIAGDCRHSCCVGWEIDIDPDTLTRYGSLPPAEREEIFAHTVTEKSCTSFRLTEDERCPFLREDGLCRLILTHGEDILCDICREHPRFYNLFSRRTEVGLGLCCEEAARLILTHPAPFRLICIDGDEGDDTAEDPFETAFFSTRTEIFAILCDRTRPLSRRINDLLRRFSLTHQGIYESDRRWQEVYRGLERLDPLWDEALSAWERADGPSALHDEIAAEQLIAYFLYRHLPDALTDGRLHERIAFALLSAHVITSVAGALDGSVDSSVLIETARAYSAEVEYDEDNVEAILCRLEQI